MSKDKVIIPPAIGDHGLGIQDPSTHDLVSFPDDAVALEAIEQPKPISSFYTVIPSKKTAKKEVAENKTQTLTVPTNNLILGDIPEEVLESIKEGYAIGLNFKDIGLRIIYKVKKDDNVDSALSNLRNAIFDIQQGKDLPDSCYYESTHGLAAGLAVRLENSIAASGEMDARIFGFPISE